MAWDHYEAEWCIEDVLTAIRKEVKIFKMSHQYSGK